MKWMRVTMTSGQVAAGEHAALQDAFEIAFMAKAAPKDAAMFEHDTSHEEYAFYFSPGAVKIFAPQLARFNAAECDAPPRKDTSLLVAHAEAWVLLGDG